MEEISYTNTLLRRNDNCIAIVPNARLIKEDIINWSRTKYRLFKTSYAVPLTELNSLPKLINDIRNKLSSLTYIEQDQRHIMVSASGFKDGKITIDIEAHFQNLPEELLCTLTSQTVEAIATALNTKG